MNLRRFFLIAEVFFACGAVRAQSVVDSSWALDHGDTLFFHHDATLEFIRANGNREVRFPDGRRLHFFTPYHFIEKNAFVTSNFNDFNGASPTAPALIEFHLANGFSHPEIFWSTFPDGEPMTMDAPVASKKHEYRFAIPFEEPGWHVVEVSANGTDRIRHIIARIMICSGDRLPLPFDTVVEHHAPPSLPRTNDRVFQFLQYDRNRASAPLQHDSSRDEAASILVTAAVEEKLHWAIIAPPRARQILGSIKSICDSSIIAVVTAMGHTPEAVAWNCWTSPTLRAMGLIKKTCGVSVGVMRVGDVLISAMMLAGKIDDEKK